MAAIKELSPHLADLIAAGEVVERPASVAKELIENAIDAGAQKITVELQNGGITFLRITDDGCGIAPEDVPVAFRRHATSKLRTEADLAAIGTLGFRGEALAAIASVSRIDLLTKQKGALAGTHLHLEAGKITEQEDAGCPEGTTIIVRDLFFNTPARMKFLKKDYTEAGYVFGVLQHAALSHPEIAFTMLKDGKQVFCTAGDGKLMTPIFGVFGKEMTDSMVEVQPFERDNFCVWGYVTKPHLARPNRTMQHFFVNGRYVKNRTMQAALEEAYRNKIISGKYPSCTIYLTLPLSAVDVNVHPAKTEIKFAQEKQVFEIVYIACKNTLEKNDNIPELAQKKAAVKEDNITDEQQRITPLAPQHSPEPSANLIQGKSAEQPMEPVGAKPTPSAPAWKAPNIDCDDFDGESISTGKKLNQPPLTILTRGEAEQHKPSSFSESLRSVGLPLIVKESSEGEPEKASETQIEENVPKAAAEDTQAQPEPEARVIGEAFHTYIVAEDQEGLLLIDKHAAHERMIFNKLRKTAEIPQQQILTPVIVDPSPTESAVLMEHLDEVRAAGFDIEPFGNGSFALRGAPAYLDCADIPSVLSEMAGKLMASRAATSDRFDELIHMVSCKAAIKAGGHSSMSELQSLCDRVLSDPDIAACPHGRPVTVRLTRYELDKLFKRVNQ